MARFFDGPLDTVLDADFGPRNSRYPYLRDRKDVDIRGSMSKGIINVVIDEDMEVEFRYNVPPGIGPRTVLLDPLGIKSSPTWALYLLS